MRWTIFYTKREIEALLSMRVKIPWLLFVVCLVVYLFGVKENGLSNARRTPGGGDNNDEEDDDDDGMITWT